MAGSYCQHCMFFFLQHKIIKDVSSLEKRLRSCCLLKFVLNFIPKNSNSVMLGITFGGSVRVMVQE